MTTCGSATRGRTPYAYAKGAGLDVEYMNPKEGRITWSCGLGLFSGSQNYYHGHAYVDSWSSGKAAAFLVGSYYYGHANTGGIDLGDISPDIVKALSLDDLSICAAELEPGVAHPGASRSTPTPGTRSKRPEP